MPDNKTVTFDASQYQLVPKMPTEEMIDAAREKAISWSDGFPDHEDGYRAMLDAAPTPAAQSAGQEPIYQARVYGGWDDVSRSEFEQIEANERPKRIVYAAPVNASELVAWFTDDHLTDKSATTWDRSTAERWRAKGWPVHGLCLAAPVNGGEREHVATVKGGDEYGPILEWRKPWPQLIGKRLFVGDDHE